MVKATVERSKVVVKNLPPLLPQETFVSAVDAVFGGNYISLRYVSGRQSAKGARASRAYIYVKEPIFVYDLRAKFDGHTFVNERGQQYQCSVEYAPYQKSPKVITKKDPREGTLEKDEAYQEFLARLEKDPFALPSRKVEVDENSSSQPQEIAADGKRISALMSYMQKKWAGTLEPSEGPASRQRGKSKKSKEKAVQGSTQKVGMVQSNLPPPPGFTTIATTLAAPESSSKKPKQQKKGSQSKEAAPTDTQPLFSKQGIHAEDSRLLSKKKKGRGLQGASDQGRGDRIAAPAAVSEARDRSSSGVPPSQEAVSNPRRILKKDGPEEQPTEAVPRKDKAASKAKAAKSSEGLDDQKKPTSRPVRAGYQVYTPKTRGAT